MKKMFLIAIAAIMVIAITGCAGSTPSQGYVPNLNNDDSTTRSSFLSAIIDGKTVDFTFNKAFVNDLNEVRATFSNSQYSLTLVFPSSAHDDSMYASSYGDENAYIFLWKSQKDINYIAEYREPTVRIDGQTYNRADLGMDESHGSFNIYIQDVNRTDHSYAGTFDAVMTTEDDQSSVNVFAEFFFILD